MVFGALAVGGAGGDRGPAGYLLKVTSKVFD